MIHLLAAFEIVASSFFNSTTGTWAYDMNWILKSQNHKVRA